MELFVGIIVFLGALGVFGGFHLFMIVKNDWSWAQFVSAFIVCMILAGTFPGMPQAVNDGMTGIIQSATK